MCNLSELKDGQAAIIEEMNLESRLAHRLYHLGLIPGVRIRPMMRGPKGRLRVYHVDGTNIALRRETTVNILVRPLSAAAASVGGD